MYMFMLYMTYFIYKHDRRAAGPENFGLASLA